MRMLWNKIRSEKRDIILKWKNKHRISSVNYHVYTQNMYLYEASHRNDSKNTLK